MTRIGYGRSTCTQKVGKHHGARMRKRTLRQHSHCRVEGLEIPEIAEQKIIIFIYSLLLLHTQHHCVQDAPTSKPFDAAMTMTRLKEQSHVKLSASPIGATK